MVCPAQPEHLQPFAHRPVGMCGLRLDPGADDIANQTVHRRRDPRVVPRIPPGTPRRRDRARKDRGVQPIDRPRPFPTPTTTCSVKAVRACGAQKAMEDRPLGAQCLVHGVPGVSERMGMVGNGNCGARTRRLVDH